MIYALGINIRIVVGARELNSVSIARISHERCNIRRTEHYY